MLELGLPKLKYMLQLPSTFCNLFTPSGLLHTLTGVADIPRTLGTITHDIPAKTSHVEVLTVHNWLRTPQRFSVIKEILKPDRPDPATTLKGLRNYLISKDVHHQIKIIW